MAKQDHEYGIGEREDGTIDIFPESELRQRLAEWRAQQEAETGPDDLSDLGEIEDLFGAGGDVAQDEATFEESKHPRAPDGRFGAASGEHGGGSPDKPPAAKREAAVRASLADGLSRQKADDLDETLKHYAERAAGNGVKIPGFHAALISDYTDGRSEPLNAALRSGKLTDGQREHVAMLNEAVAALPRYEGPAQSGATLTAAQQAVYKPGAVVKPREFVSASIDKQVRTGNTQFAIEATGRRGADVTKLSNHPGEHEVLFPSGSAFRVGKVEGEPGGDMKVWMEEVEGGKGGQAADAALPFAEMPALAEAAARDRLGYLDGLKRVTLLPDVDQWNAAYDFANDGIVVQGKFADKDDLDKVQTMLHEGGHRGQVVDGSTFEDFKRRGLGSVENFLAMANQVHRDDYERTGTVDGQEDEAFAESYARACLGLDMPPEIAEFWSQRFGAGALDAWSESAHPRGQPENAGEFASSGGGARTKAKATQGSATETPAFKKWFGASKVTDENGKPLVAYKAMAGDVPHIHPDTEMTHVALNPDIAKAFAGNERPVRKVYVKAEKPFDFREESDLGWLLKEMAKPKNVKEFNRQTKAVMGPDYEHEASKGEIAAGIEDGAYQMFEIPMVRDLIKARGYDGIYMVEEGQSTRQPNLAVFDPSQIKAVENKGNFDPDSDVIIDAWSESAHPRGQPENAGEFASGAGGGSSKGGAAKAPAVTAKAGVALKLYSPPKRDADEIIATVPGAQRAIAALTEKFKGVVPTNALASEGGFKQADGTYTPERAAVHRQIISKLFAPEAVKAATPAAGDKPVLTVLGGRGGSGKSWFTAPGGPVDTSKSILLDSDAIKAMLPGYENWKAPLYHDEATDLLALCDAVATKLGVNTIHDATLKSGANMAKRIKSYGDARYDVNGFYMYASPDVAAERALRRFSKGGKFTGRFVPPDVILKKNVENEKNFDDLIPTLKKWAIYDNDSPAGPRLVAGN